MKVQDRIVLFVLAGAAAGLFTWFVSDVSQLIHIPDVSRDLTPAEASQQQIVGLVFGAFVGALLGVAEGLAAGSTVLAGRAAGVGLIVGGLSGLLGMTLGASVYGLLRIREMLNPLAFLWNVLARAVGWALIGAFAGTSEGWRKASFRVGRNGFLGGLIGGLIGGTTFDIVIPLLAGLSRPAVLSRLLGFVITGASIGLFVALVQQMLKQAWIRVVVGRNEGREYLVDKVETRIGRAELSDVPLFGDPSVARTHAVLVARPTGQFVLRDAGSETGTRVNGAPIAGETPLRSGDRIEVGSRTLIFHERATRQPVQAVNRDLAAAARAAPSSLPGLGDALPTPGGAPRATGGSGTTRAPGPRLVVTEGPHAGASFPLADGAILGRDPENAIALPADSKASRTHARLVRNGLGYVIEDTGSTNGTFVNGQRVQRQSLALGDTVLIGTSALRVEQGPPG